MYKLKVLIYGDVDLNVIDGSAVWLTSMVKMLNISPDISVDVLLKSRIKHNYLISEVENLHTVRIINPFENFSYSKFIKKNRLHVKEAVEIINNLDSKHQYHCIIIRGFELSKAINSHPIITKTIPYITNFTHSKEHMPEQEKDDLISIYNNVQHMFVQTDEMKDLLRSILRVDGEKFRLLLPMIPEYEKEVPSFKNKKNVLVYVGKFAKGWKTKEILEAFKRINERDKGISLNIAGNKFQGDIGDQKSYLIGILENGSGINWSGGLSRTESQTLIKNSDLGIGWRSKNIDNDSSVELSTKLLEYGQHGKPFLVNRTKMHEKIFGDDYPLFIDDEEDFINKTLEAFSNPQLYRRAAKRVYEVCKQYTFSESYNRIKATLWSYNKDKINIVFAGHDLKFIKMAIDYFEDSEKYNVRIDKWNGHDKHDKSHSQQCLEWADVIFCEWGLGNAVWYSNNKMLHQKLIVRMHLQERETDFPNSFNLDKIDKIIAISPFIYEEFYRSCKIPRNKMAIIYNMIDTKSLDKAKTDPDVKFNLGICGILPSRKRLDRAINIFEKLWDKDKRYKLFIKSKLPQELPWLMRRKEEKEYFEDVFKRIDNASWKENVVFDKHGNDMDEWFRKIGYVLSTSDFESFHLAPMEGMASGSVPVVLHWNGAETIYPDEYIFENEDEMVYFIDSGKSKEQIGTRELKGYPKKNFDKERIVDKINSVISDMY